MRRATYSFIEGGDLVDLILEVREEFLGRTPYDLDDARQPNSVRLVALAVLEDRSNEVRARIIGDLDVVELDLRLADVEPSEVFAQAATPREYLTDLVCEVVSQVLRRDEYIRSEDHRRLQLAAASSAELELRWLRDSL
jgi:hypothetical protein